MSMNIKQAASSHPTSVRAKDDLSAAYLRMKREGFRHLPVIDDSGDLAGIISDRDFQRANQGQGDDANFKAGAKVSEYMTSKVETLPEDTDLLTAVRAMIDKKISAVVVTRQGSMVGIVTHEDMLRVLAGLLSGPISTKEKVLAFTYNSPLGSISSMLAMAGL